MDIILILLYINDETSMRYCYYCKAFRTLASENVFTRMNLVFYETQRSAEYSKDVLLFFRASQPNTTVLLISKAFVQTINRRTKYQIEANEIPDHESNVGACAALRYR
jgi:hypothetical protein